VAHGPGEVDIDALWVWEKPNRLLKYRFYTPRLRQFRGTYPLTHAKKIACSAFCEVSIFRESPQKRYFSSLLTPELTGAGGPIGPQGTNIGHQNREAMANVGVRVERFVRLGRVGRV